MAYQPTALDLFVNEITAPPEMPASYEDLVYPFTVRPPLDTYADIEALTQYLGKSRVKVANHLLQVAIEAVYEALPEGVATELKKDAQERLHDLINNHTKQLTEEGVLE